MQEPTAPFGEFWRAWNVELLGLIGAIASLSFWEKLTLVVAFSAVFVGLLATVLGTPIIMHFLPVPDPIKASVAGVVGLLLGVTGFLALAGIHKAVRKLAEDVPDALPGIVKRWLERRAGVGSDDTRSRP